ncbi:MAG: NAD(P)/FAD-dependent oxidoreductase [Planctomycetota bacterium]|jgi:predicted NAD/FAD-binding protein
MRIAVVGTGIAGMVAAYRLSREHDVTVFEARDRLGGHTHTVDVEQDGQPYAVDTGFIVFNDRTYPNFVRLLDELGVASQPSAMSFSVRCERTGLEYNGTSLNTLFAQRRNLFRRSFLRMIRDIMRFNREATRLAVEGDYEDTIGAFIHGYGREFIEHYIVPMGAAIWSAAPEALLDMPALFFARFFHHHGMLTVNDRPQWRVVRGGSSRYVEALTRPYADHIRLGCPVRTIRRHATHVDVVTDRLERFDEVVLALHSDQALRLLADPSRAELSILDSIRYQPNDVVLHTDDSLLPRRPLARAAWNYHLARDPARQVAVTYDMNILQSLRSRRPFLVTLNRTDEIDPTHIIQKLTYAHPVFTRSGVAAQGRWSEISGVNRTHYCGAYWSYGFHEDGVKSALRVVDAIGQAVPA